MTLVVPIDGSCTLGREAIGSKAWGVNRMAALGLPVPAAMVITTQACREFFARGNLLDDALWQEIVAGMRALEARCGRSFGAPSHPLLVSVRSGAAHSMPGMMDTILDLGIGDAVERAMAAEYASAARAHALRLRFIEQYRKVVLGGREDPVPEDPWTQLRAAVGAVFGSWHSPRAQAYRRNRDLPDGEGTAVTIQAMVFGDADARSGTGVLFTRSPIAGDPAPWGEWLQGAQGEDVVSGTCTPLPLTTLERQMPGVYRALIEAGRTIERDACDMQDIEFTVESGHLWLLQTRTGKRSPQAALRIAVAFAEEGLISQEQAVRRLSAEQVRLLPALQLAAQAQIRAPDVAGEPACPGVAVGVVVSDSREAETRSRAGETVILARPTTSPEDLPGILAAAGLMTEQGGATSHAAVVCRELGRPCVVGCGPGSLAPLAGAQATLDGTRGRVWRGNLAIDASDEGASVEVRRLTHWALPLSPVPVYLPEGAPEGTVDLDILGDAWREGLRPGITVRGAPLETDAGIQAALEAGVTGIVVRHRLPALLDCLASQVRAPARSGEAIEPADDDRPDPLTLLRLVALKGQPSLDVLADSLGVRIDAAFEHYRALFAHGYCTAPDHTMKLTPAGQEKMKSLLAQERAHADAAAIQALYRTFLPLNAALKRIVTSWQLREGAPNDHSDEGHDGAVVERLTVLHQQAGPLLAQLAALVPRLSRYANRLSRAQARVSAGERRYIARIVADSYHTVWFELHEELIALLGTTRAELAREPGGDGA